MSVISNPLGTGVSNTDTTDAQQPTTRPIKVGSTAVTAGQVVVWDSVNTTTAVPTCSPGSVAATTRVAGVVVQGAPAGGVALVARSGPVKVNIGSGTVTAGGQATAGAGGIAVATAEPDAGATFGVFLGAEIGSTDQAYVDVRLGG